MISARHVELNRSLARVGTDGFERRGLSSAASRRYSWLLGAGYCNSYGYRCLLHMLKSTMVPRPDVPVLSLDVAIRNTEERSGNHCERLTYISQAIATKLEERNTPHHLRLPASTLWPNSAKPHALIHCLHALFVVFARCLVASQPVAGTRNAIHAQL